jgi:hypothetical protein
MAVPPFNPGTLSYNGAKPSTEVASAIRQASARTGVDFKYLVAQAGQESSFKPDAQASTSSAKGLYQFIESTWLTMVRDKGGAHGLGDLAQQIDSTGSGPRVADAATRRKILDLRNDPMVSAAMAAEFAKSNRSQLEQNLGRPAAPTDLYMAHFLGASGATKFLNALNATPTKTGAEILPDAAAANRGAFYDKQGQPLSVKQIYQHYAERFDGAVAEAPSVAAATSPKQGSLNQTAALKSAIFSALAGQQLSSVTIDALMKLRVPEILSRHKTDKA